MGSGIAGEAGRTIFPNVFLAGDTVSADGGLAGISRSALDLVNILMDRK
jgi:hypothetical protein